MTVDQPSTEQQEQRWLQEQRCHEASDAVYNAVRALNMAIGEAVVAGLLVTVAYEQLPKAMESLVHQQVVIAAQVSRPYDPPAPEVAPAPYTSRNAGQGRLL